MDHIMPIVKSSLRRQCWSKFYAIIMVYTYLWKELWQFETLQLQRQLQIIKAKKIIFKNFAPFTDCISEINNTLIDNAKDFDIVMPMYNLVEFSDNYLKASAIV